MPDVHLTFRCDQAVDNIWERLLSERALCALGDLRRSNAGDAFSIETAAGDIFEGVVVRHIVDSHLSLRIDNMYGSELSVTTRSTDQSTDRGSVVELEFTLESVGLHHDEIESFGARWAMQLGDLFGPRLTR